MTLALGAQSFAQQVRLLGPNREAVPARSAWFESTPFDHVVRSVDDLPPLSGGFYDLTSGSWAFANDLTLADAIRVASGEVVYLSGLGWGNTLTTTASRAIQNGGTLLVHALNIVSSQHGIQVIGASADLWCSGCRVSSGAACVLVSVGRRVFIQSSDLIGTGAGSTGRIDVAGAVEELTAMGVAASAGASSFIRRASGTQRSVIVRACSVTTPTGIAWDAAGMPTAGMLVAANHFNCATPINGFTSASARVNMKCNTGSAGLLSETAIVP